MLLVLFEVKLQLSTFALLPGEKAFEFMQHEFDWENLQR